ncbi:MAG: mannitol dehydrogenase, partial [Armatimonadota bacterium]
MSTAVQFGAGNIGRGFIGQLFSESGFEVVYVDVVQEVVDKLNEDHRYTITIAAEPEEQVEVSNVRAVNGRDLDAVAQEVAKCDIAATAVGVNVMGSIAEPLAMGIRRRRSIRPDDTLNIIVCENMQDAAGHLRGLVRAKLSADDAGWLDARVGFTQAVVGRMVPVRTPEERSADPLGVKVEAYKKLPIDKDALRGDAPTIAGILPTGNFQAYIDRKLFAHNAGHAVSAYHGFLRGHTFIWECMEDEYVREKTRLAMVETGEALIRRYGLDAEEHWAHVDDLLNR